MKDYENESLKIRPVRADEFQVVFALCEKRFGKGYMNREEFDQWLKYPEFFLAAEQDGAFCGFVCYFPEEAEDLAKYMRLPRDYVELVSGGKPVIHCKTAVLFPEYEHSGIMHNLVERATDNAKAMGFGAAFAPAWKYKNHVPVRKLLNRLGFEELVEKENIWYDMENYECIICGGRCRCSAVIFQKTL